MIIDAQIRSLQNFADNFELTVKYYQFDDLRKRTKFILVKNTTSITQPLSYEEMNIFLLGIKRCKEFNI
jgi:predicted P-loop ATPase/GTPase